MSEEEGKICFAPPLPFFSSSLPPCWFHSLHDNSTKVDFLLSWVGLLWMSMESGVWWSVTSLFCYILCSVALKLFTYTGSAGLSCICPYMLPSGCISIQSAVKWLKMNTHGHIESSDILMTDLNINCLSWLCNSIVKRRSFRVKKKKRTTKKQRSMAHEIQFPMDSWNQSGLLLIC